MNTIPKTTKEERYRLGSETLTIIVCAVMLVQLLTIMYLSLNIQGEYMRGVNDGYESRTVFKTSGNPCTVVLQKQN